MGFFYQEISCNRSAEEPKAEKQRKMYVLLTFLLESPLMSCSFHTFHHPYSINNIYILFLVVFWLT